MRAPLGEEIEREEEAAFGGDRDADALDHLVLLHELTDAHPDAGRDQRGDLGPPEQHEAPLDPIDALELLGLGRRRGRE